MVISGLLTYLGTPNRDNFFLETASNSEIKITNGYTLAVNIFINGREMGMIEAGKDNGFDLNTAPQMTADSQRRVLGNSHVYLIEVKDNAGIIVYSRVYNWSDLWDINWELSLPDKGERRY
jgi:hypothetical protein